MTRFCKICGRGRANERFGGKGLRRVVCNQCRKLPKEQQLRVLCTDEVLGLLEQSNISAKNIKRLTELQAQPDDCLSQLASTVREIAELYPRKKKRWGWLRARRRRLYEKAVELGLCEDHSLPSDFKLGENLEGVWIESRRANDQRFLLDLSECPLSSCVIESSDGEYEEDSLWDAFELH